MERLVLKYIEFLKNEGGSSENTLNSYMSDLKMYIRYLRNKNITEFTDTDTDTLNLYIQLLTDENMAKRTISRKLSVLKSFYRFLKNNDIISENPAESIEGVKAEKRNMTAVSNMKADFIINLPDIGEYSGIRDMAVLETLYGAGIRISEVIKLKLCDVDFKENIITLRTEKKSRTIPMYERLANILEIYIKYSRPRFVKKDDNEILFLNKSGGNFSRQGIWKMIRKYIDKIPDGKDITPNKLRQSMLVHLFENGADEEYIQGFAGYKDFYSLKRYKNAAKYRKRKLSCRIKDPDLRLLKVHPRKTAKCFEINKQLIVNYTIKK